MEDVVKKMVEDAGFKVGIDSDECTLYRTIHENCKGCNYELGCCKLNAIGLLQLVGVTYQSKDFDDFRASLKRTGELIAEVIKAQTVDEVNGYV